MQTKFFRIMALVGMLAITIGPSSSALAQTTPVTTVGVGTSATVGTGGSTTSGPAPRIECKWELPDMQAGVTTGGFPDPAIQYTTATPADLKRDDDTPSKPTLADGSTATTPCALGTPTTLDPVGKPTQLQGDRHMIQVRPNAHDLPEQRRIQVWGAIDPPTDGSGVSTAFDGVNWDIYHPDGTLKIEVYGTRVPVSACAQLGISTTVGSVFEAAVQTGQVAATAVDDSARGLAYWCTQGKQFWYSSFRLSKHQPCGEYTVKLNAKAGNGTGIATLTNTFDVICFTNLELDFNNVNYGLITPGFGKVIPGDMVWETLGTAQDPGPVMPTVRNTGNSGMAIRLTFSDMVRALTAAEIAAGVTADRITEFDACFAAALTYGSTVLPSAPTGNVSGLTAHTLLCKNQIFSNTATTMRDSETPGDTTLCANRLGKLDLSIHPQSGIQPGSYTGTLSIVAVTSRICLTDNGHVDTTTISGANNPNYPGLPTGDGLQPGDVNTAA